MFNVISKKQMEYYIYLGLSAQQIAEEVKMSRPTINKMVKVNYPNLLPKLRENGKKRWGGNRK
jgi:predicted DNA-binding protein YlxM (UPF0122 family)